VGEVRLNKPQIEKGQGIMGTLYGKILLDEKKVRALRKELRRNESVPGRTKAQIELVFKMALRYMNWVHRFNGLYGKYEECFPEIARGICETFFADETELAACFRISPRMIREWQLYYVDFKKQIKLGRRRFISEKGSTVCRRRWFHLKFARIAKNVRNIFGPTKKQIRRCFEIEAQTWKQIEFWMKESCYKTTYTQLEDIRHQVFTEMVNRLCGEFRPDNEQLARCLGIDTQELEEWMKTDYLFRNAIDYARTTIPDIFGLMKTDDKEAGQSQQ
jgi:hypothetical protein